MLITLRLPRSSAARLNITVPDMDGQDLVKTLTAVELAGRLSLAQGKPIGPEAVVRYCLAWQAANETLARLVRELGKRRLAGMLRKGCSEWAIWAPPSNAGALRWLQCVLEAHFLSMSLFPSGNRTRDQREHRGGLDLVELCRANFAQAYSLWLADQVPSAAPKRSGRPAKGP